MHRNKCKSAKLTLSAEYTGKNTLCIGIFIKCDNTPHLFKFTTNGNIKTSMRREDCLF